MILTETDKEILQSLQIDDNAKTVTITRQLDRKQYQRTNELLETAGGTWSRKAKAHVFSVTPSDALKVFINGETATVTTTLETKKEKKEKRRKKTRRAAENSRAKYLSIYATRRGRRGHLRRPLALPE